MRRFRVAASNSESKTNPALLPRWRSALLVGAGGALGTMLRWLLSVAVPEPGGVPLGMLLINLLGSFLLGLLLGRLPASSARTERTRLFLGTGVLGGFTSYSALALGSFELIAEGRVLVGAVYSVGTVVLGLAFAALGAFVASSLPSQPRVSDQNSAQGSDA